MRILYHHRIGSKDGQSVHIDGLVGSLRNAGHEVIVVGPAAAHRMEFGDEAGAIGFIRRQLPRAIAELLELAYNIPAFVRLYGANGRRRPAIIYERYNLFFLAGAVLRCIQETPFLLEVNAPLFDERNQYGGLSLKRIARRAELFVWRRADLVLPVTEVLAQTISAAGVDPSRIVVVANGVSEDFLVPGSEARAFRRELGVDGRLVLGFVGFVRAWHGIETAIDVIAERGEALDLHLLVVGDGPAIDDLRRHAAERRVADRVTFVGLVPRSKIRRHIEAFDVALQPKVVPYASPLKIFEYMALGLPIIAPDTPNIREILRDGETALLVQRDRPEELANAIEKLANDAQLRKRLARNAKQALFDRRLTWHANAERVVTLAKSILDKRVDRERVAADPRSGVRHTGEPV